jgi:hypothetical protein
MSQASATVQHLNSSSNSTPSRSCPTQRTGRGERPAVRRPSAQRREPVSLAEHVDRDLLRRLALVGCLAWPS